MNYICRVILLLLVVAGCREEPALSFSSEVFTEEDLDFCKTEFCSSVTIQYLTATGIPSVSEKINSVIEAYIADALFLGDNESPSLTTIPRAATHFIMAYRDHQPDLPSDLDLGGYEAEINIENTHQTESLVCLEAYKFLFTGGAHGYSGTSFLFFDTATGDTLKPEHLFTDLSAFEKFAETKFRKVHEIPESGSINASGYWFQDDQFYLPEALGIRDDKLVLIYNTYEISNNADGPIQLEIMLEEVAPYFNSDLL